jgi:hypothetical protein
MRNALQSANRALVSSVREVNALIGVSPGLILRASLVALFVIACHQLDWRGARFLTSECILQISLWLGIPIQRLSFDVIQFNGQQFQFGVSCAYIDVVCGSIPLIWNLAVSVWRNLLKLTLYCGCLFVFNVLRLELGYVLYAQGVPWVFAHEVIGGVALFLIFLWVIRQPRGEMAARPMRESFS